MNRLGHAKSSKNRIRPRATVLGGAALGLIAGAAAYGIVSTGPVTASSPTPLKPVLISATSSPAAPAPCARGQKLERGVCIVHVRRTVVLAAERSRASVSPGSNPGSERTSTGRRTAGGARQESAEPDLAAGHAEEGAEHAEEGAEHAREGAEHAEGAEAEEGQP